MAQIRDSYQGYVDYVGKIKTQGMGAAFKSQEELAANGIEKA